MAGYDAAKDILIEKLGDISDKLYAELRQYGDDGEPKVAVYQKVGKRGTVIQVFRLPLGEVTALGEFLTNVTAKLGTYE
jgi:hypothetical protein